METKSEKKEEMVWAQPFSFIFISLFPFQMGISKINGNRKKFG